jgi:hypothetical protein
MTSIAPVLHSCLPCLLLSPQDLRAKADLMERRLLAAERLIAGLGSEKERWAADIKALEAAREQLVGDCLLCSSFLSYTGEEVHLAELCMCVTLLFITCMQDGTATAWHVLVLQYHMVPAAVSLTSCALCCIKLQAPSPTSTAHQWCTAYGSLTCCHAKCLLVSPSSWSPS